MDFSLDWRNILSLTLILFAIIDVLGNIPVIIALRNRGTDIQAGRATFVSGALMIAFLFLGERILSLIGIDISSFATAGAIVIFIIALEMILGIEIFKSDITASSASSVVPVAFPLIAGAGTLTTLLSLRAEYPVLDIIVAIVINLVVVYAVLRWVPWLERKLGRGGTEVLRRAFGVVLLAIAVKLFKTYSGVMG